MAKEVFMPKAGMDMKEGVIIQWFAEVGDEVKEGDALLEIETDKVTMEVESPADGTLLCRYFENRAVVPVVTVIAYVGEAGEKVPDKPPMAGQRADATPARPSAATVNTEKIIAGRPGKYEYDAAIIGGGPAGYVAAIRMAQLGGRAVLFEKENVGGVCLNRGCIPTKTYLKTAEYIHNIQEAALRGIRIAAEKPGVDMRLVHEHKQKVVKKLTEGVASLLKSRGVTVVSGRAKLTDNHTVECEGKKYQAGSVILCGGSNADRTSIPGADGPKVVTSDGILDITFVPGRLAVIGGGVIGCEIASAFSAFGSQVTVIELMERVVPMMDEELSGIVRKSMEKMGVEVLCAQQVEQIEESGEVASVVLRDGRRIDAELVLLSIGRKANLECLGDLFGSIRTERGKVVVDEYCRTNVEGVYACGDLTTASSLAHSAFKMGEVAAANAMAGNEKADLSLVPACLYTIPEAAGLGLNEAEAGKRGDIIVGKFPFSANGRAIASGDFEGLVKVVADKKYGEILGVHIVGANATEMIATAKVLMDMEATIHEAAEIIFAHPTYSEALAEACAHAMGRCIHRP